MNSFGGSSLSAIPHVHAITLLLLTQPRERVQAVVFLLGLLFLASDARGQELTADWFRAQYLPAVSKLEEAYGTTSAVTTQTSTSTLNKNHSGMKIKFALDGLRCKFDRTINDYVDGQPSSWTRSIVASPEVNFMILTKHASKPYLEWVDRSELAYNFAHNRIHEQACESVFSAFAVLGRSMSSWLSDKEFKIMSVIMQDDRIRLVFDYTGDPKAEREYDGWIDFLPNRQWVIDAWEITIRAPKENFAWRDVTKLNYASDGPVPKLLDMTLVEHHPTYQTTRKTAVNELVFDVEEDAFRLSSYGYHDRIGLPARMTDSIWFWAAIVGVLCLLAAPAIRYRMKAA
jgi:hypothetical protein